MMVSYILTSFGLFLDVIGVILLFKYGVYSKIQMDFLIESSKALGTRIVLDKPPRENFENFSKKYYKHETLSKRGLWLLIFGFVFQFFGLLAQIPDIDWSCVSS